MVGPRTLPQTGGEGGREKENTVSSVQKMLEAVTYLFVGSERL